MSWSADNYKDTSGEQPFFDHAKSFSFMESGVHHYDQSPWESSSQNADRGSRDFASKNATELPGLFLVGTAEPDESTSSAGSANPVEGDSVNYKGKEFTVQGVEKSYLILVGALEPDREMRMKENFFQRDMVALTNQFSETGQQLYYNRIRPEDGAFFIDGQTGSGAEREYRLVRDVRVKLVPTQDVSVQSFDGTKGEINAHWIDRDNGEKLHLECVERTRKIGGDLIRVQTPLDRDNKDRRRVLIGDREINLERRSGWFAPDGTKLNRAPENVKIHITCLGPTDLMNLQRVLLPLLEDLRAQGKVAQYKTMDPRWIDPQWGQQGETILTPGVGQGAKGFTVYLNPENVAEVAKILDQSLTRSRLAAEAVQTGNVADRTARQSESGRISIERARWEATETLSGTPAVLIEQCVVDKLRAGEPRLFDQKTERLTVEGLRQLERMCGMLADSLALDAKGRLCFVNFKRPGQQQDEYYVEEGTGRDGQQKTARRALYELYNMVGLDPATVYASSIETMESVLQKLAEGDATAGEGLERRLKQDPNFRDHQGRKELTPESIEKFQKAANAIAEKFGLSEKEGALHEKYKPALMQLSKDILAKVSQLIIEGTTSDNLYSGKPADWNSLRVLLKTGLLTNLDKTRETLKAHPDLLEQFEKFLLLHPQAPVVQAKVAAILSALQVEMRALGSAAGVPALDLSLRDRDTALGGYNHERGISISEQYLTKAQLRSPDFVNTIVHELAHAEHDVLVLRYLMHELGITNGEQLAEMLPTLDHRFSQANKNLSDKFAEEVFARFGTEALSPAERVRAQLLLLDMARSKILEEQRIKIEDRAASLAELSQLNELANKIARAPNAETIDQLRAELVELAGREVEVDALLKRFDNLAKLYKSGKSGQDPAVTLAIEKLNSACLKLASKLLDHCESQYMTFSEQDAHQQGERAEKIAKSAISTASDRLFQALFGESTDSHKHRSFRSRSSVEGQRSTKSEGRALIYRNNDTDAVPSIGEAIGFNSDNGNGLVRTNERLPLVELGRFTRTASGTVILTEGSDSARGQELVPVKFGDRTVYQDVQGRVMLIGGSPQKLIYDPNLKTVERGSMLSLQEGTTVRLSTATAEAIITCDIMLKSGRDAKERFALLLRTMSSEERANFEKWQKLAFAVDAALKDEGTQKELNKFLLSAEQKQLVVRMAATIEALSLNGELKGSSRMRFIVDQLCKNETLQQLSIAYSLEAKELMAGEYFCKFGDKDVRLTLATPLNQSVVDEILRWLATKNGGATPRNIRVSALGSPEGTATPRVLEISLDGATDAATTRLLYLHEEGHLLHAQISDQDARSLDQLRKSCLEQQGVKKMLAAKGFSAQEIETAIADALKCEIYTKTPETRAEYATYLLSGSEVFADLHAIWANARMQGKELTCTEAIQLAREQHLLGDVSLRYDRLQNFEPVYRDAQKIFQKVYAASETTRGIPARKEGVPVSEETLRLSQEIGRRVREQVEKSGSTLEQVDRTLLAELLRAELDAVTSGTKNPDLENLIQKCVTGDRASSDLLFGKSIDSATPGQEKIETLVILRPETASVELCGETLRMHELVKRMIS